MIIERSQQMGARAKLSVPERRKVVLSLIRREEPAAVLARRCGISENHHLPTTIDELGPGDYHLAISSGVDGGRTVWRVFWGTGAVAWRR
jgi:hypothetical protein